eukprot:2584665-Pleurochrysis_carterae.AAC.1
MIISSAKSPLTVHQQSPRRKLPHNGDGQSWHMSAMELPWQLEAAGYFEAGLIANRQTDPLDTCCAYWATSYTETSEEKGKNEHHGEQFVKHMSRQFAEGYPSSLLEKKRQKSIR